MTNIPDNVEVTINGNAIAKKEFDCDDYLKIYNVIWQNMDRENALINHRISWALWITAAFITAQAFIAGRIIQFGMAPDAHVLQSVSCFFMGFMSIAAVYGTWRAKEAVGAAITQLSYLKYFYLNTKGNGQNLFETYLHLPRPFGDPAMHRSGNNAAKAFGPALTTLWIVLTLVELAAGLLFLSKSVIDKAKAQQPAVNSKDDSAFHRLDARPRPGAAPSSCPMWLAAGMECAGRHQLSGANGGPRVGAGTSSPTGRPVRADA